jgi:hypothetical protein
MDFPESSAVESGRPVVVVPYIGRYNEIGRNVVIAWKAGPKSARAVFDALPILQAADKVHILTGSRGGVLAPDTTIVASISRHGIKPTVQTSVAADMSAGDDILSRLAGDLDFLGGGDATFTAKDFHAALLPRSASISLGGPTVSSWCRVGKKCIQTMQRFRSG